MAYLWYSLCRHRQATWWRPEEEGEWWRRWWWCVVSAWADLNTVSTAYTPRLQGLFHAEGQCHGAWLLCGCVTVPVTGCGCLAVAVWLWLWLCVMCLTAPTTIAASPVPRLQHRGGRIDERACAQATWGFQAFSSRYASCVGCPTRDAAH